VFAVLTTVAVAVPAHEAERAFRRRERTLRCAAADGGERRVNISRVTDTNRVTEKDEIRMATFDRTLLAAVMGGFVAIAPNALAQPKSQGEVKAPTDAQARELQQQIQSLQAELDQLRTAQDPATRRRLMDQHWQGMGNYMGHMRRQWGMGEPWMMRDEDDYDMGCPGTGCGGGWFLPQGVSPEQYSQQMSEHMQRMQQQMNAIAQATDPRERERLMQEQWRGMYRDMQTMHGMGWMWNGPMMGRGMMPGAPVPGGPPPSAAPLPDPDATGAKLVSTYCTQCHATPRPTLHTGPEWSAVTDRIHAHISGGWAGIKTPSDQDMTVIIAYMQHHAR
jgi:hypothetical protein